MLDATAILQPIIYISQKIKETYEDIVINLEPKIRVVFLLLIAWKGKQNSLFSYEFYYFWQTFHRTLTFFDMISDSRFRRRHWTSNGGK